LAFHVSKSIAMDMLSTTPSPNPYATIPVEKIKPSPHQARTQFDPDAIQGLAESMRQEGQLQPIVVQRRGDTYELISGERRTRAARLLGWQAIEAKIVEPLSEAEAAAKGLVENLQRENLNPVDEAKGFKDLKDLNDKYWTQERIGQVCGKKQDYISRSLALLNLPQPVLALMRQRVVSREHGIELLRLHTPKAQKIMARKIARGDWSVKKTRAAVAEILFKAGQPANPSRPADPLGDLWLGLLSDSKIAPRGSWDVNFGPFQVKGGKKTDLLGWTFFMSTAMNNPKGELVAWLRKLAAAIEKGNEPPPVQKLPPPALNNMPRLPQTAEEERTLETLAALGPGAVYGWIWGPESLMARTMAKMSWQEIGAKDAISGCRNIVDVLRQLQSS
jgi:ParB family chromosome partitioning protein